MDVSATLLSSQPTIDASAVAILYVDLSSMQNTFQYQSDSLNMNDISASDIKYYVFNSYFPTFNPANAQLDDALSSGPIATAGSNGVAFASNVMQVKHDFVRYIALKLFDTHNGVDLFSNVDELLNSVTTVCGSGSSGNTWYDVSASLASVSAVNGTHSGILTDASGNKYMTETVQTPDNLCRELMLQLFYSNSDRFNEIADSDLIQPLPFIEGDSFSFLLNINPIENQHTLTGADPFGGHSYRIKMVINSSMV
jgi:hypothetical protein